MVALPSADVRPKTRTRSRLRPAVHVAPVTAGLLVVGWQSRVVVSGGTALHRLWAALEPHLEEGVVLDDLVGALPAGAQEPARTLLESLDDAGMLVPVHDRVPEAARTGSVARLMDFLDSAAPAPGAAWRRISEAVVTVHGAGAVAERAAALLLQHGVAEVHVGAGDAARKMADHPGPGKVVEDTGTAYRPDVVVVVDDAAGAPAAPVRIDVVSLGDRAIVLPPSAGRDTLLGTLAAMRRRGGDVTVTPCPRTVALIAAGQAVVNVVYALADVTTETDGQVVSIHADRLRVSHHPAWQHDAVPLVPGAVDDDVEHDPALLTRLTDELTGLLPEALPGDRPQTPFAVLRSSDGSVFGYGRTSSSARYRATLEAARHLLESERGLPSSFAVLAAGATGRQLVVDGMTRWIARSVAGRGADGLLVESTGPGLDASTKAIAAARHGLRTVVRDTDGFTVQHSRLTHDPSLLAVAAVWEAAGGLRAVALGEDPEDALVRAVDHATARHQADGRGVVAQLALPSPAGEETTPWDGDLDRLALAVARVPLDDLAILRVDGTHPLAGLGVLGLLTTSEVVS